MASIKDVQVTEEAFSSQKRTFSTSKHEISFFFYFCSIFAILDPDPDMDLLTLLNPVLGSGSETLLISVHPYSITPGVGQGQTDFIYRRPTLYPLEIAVDFLKSL